MQPFSMLKYMAKIGRRSIPMALTAELLLKSKPKIMIETGTMRSLNWQGDGCSTVIWSDLAEYLDSKFYTVDISEENIDFALENTSKPLIAVISDSIEFLKEFDKPIDFLYLDSFDLDTKDPFPAMEFNLMEFKAAEDKLHDKSIVLIDDSHGTLDNPSGKAGITAQYMLKSNWKCLYYGAQALFIKNV